MSFNQAQVNQAQVNPVQAYYLVPQKPYYLRDSEYPMEEMRDVTANFTQISNETKENLVRNLYHRKMRNQGTIIGVCNAPNIAIAEQINGKGGYFLKKTTEETGVDLIWYNKWDSTYIFWGPTTFKVVDAMNRICSRIIKYVVHVPVQQQVPMKHQQQQQMPVKQHQVPVKQYQVPVKQHQVPVKQVPTEDNALEMRFSRCNIADTPPPPKEKKNQQRKMSESPLPKTQIYRHSNIADTPPPKKQKFRHHTITETPPPLPPKKNTVENRILPSKEEEEGLIKIRKNFDEDFYVQRLLRDLDNQVIDIYEFFMEFDPYAESLIKKRMKEHEELQIREAKIIEETIQKFKKMMKE
jgi:hypothetical protein